MKKKDVQILELWKKLSEQEKKEVLSTLVELKKIKQKVLNKKEGR